MDVFYSLSAPLATSFVELECSVAGDDNAADEVGAECDLDVDAHGYAVDVGSSTDDGDPEFSHVAFDWMNMQRVYISLCTFFACRCCFIFGWSMLFHIRVSIYIVTLLLYLFLTTPLLVDICRWDTACS